MKVLQNCEIVKVILLLIAVWLIGVPAEAKYDGGIGEPNDPYRIASAEHLMLLGGSPEDYDKHFILTADVDLDPNLPGCKVFDRAVIAADTNDTQSGFQGTPFTGVLDGSGHKILHLTITGVDYVGLFGAFANGAEVKDLGLVDVNVTGADDLVGGLVGYNDQGDISNCYSSGALRGDMCVGGLVGRNEYGDMTHCYSSGAVSGGSAVGGLVGENKGAVIGCYSTGAVSNAGMYTGGLVGHNYGVVSQSYSTSAVSATKYVGGLLGENWGTVTGCYSTGAVSGSHNVGGLLGYGRQGALTQCYSSGAVSGQWSVGGLVGENYGGLQQCCSSFWDIQTSGRRSSDGGTGLTTAQMCDVQTYQDAGWDFCGEVEDGLHEIWQMPEEGGYPVLAILNGYRPPRLQGVGTPQAPYLISNAQELGAIINYSPSAHYRLTACIDLSGIRWGMAVIPWFAARFDGNNLTISHLTIAGESYLGLFGQLGFRAEVKDVGVVDANVTGSGSGIGPLVGRSYQGEVIHCYSSGVVSGNDNVGGLAGSNSKGVLIQSYSSSVVSGSSSVGGLIGGNLGSSVTTSYSTGAVSGNNRVGGLVGYNGGVLTHCYSTGAVSGDSDVGGLVGYRQGTVISSFWDMESSGQVSSVGGTGKTTAEMQMAGTFVDAGWDFVDEVLNGTCDYWQMSPCGYPRLRYQAGDRPVMPEGSGTPEQPYLIRDALDLGSVWIDPTAHYRLEAPVDLSGVTWSTPVIQWFAGTFDGNGHAISNVTITGTSRLGLFGQLAPGAEVRDLGVVDVNVAGSGNYVGGLVGHNRHGCTAHCYSSGAVSGEWFVGGLVGYNYGGSVTDCCSSGTVSGNSSTGGLVGGNPGGRIARSYSNGAVSSVWDAGGLVGVNAQGRLLDCYSTAAVNGQSYVGGLLGYGSYYTGQSGVTNCYSTGAVSGDEYVGGLVGDGAPWFLAGCFWDTQTSGQAASPSGTGKTTAEMQMAGTFLDAGWDFVGEMDNGTQNIWAICEGVDYPRLAWEFTIGDFDADADTDLADFCILAEHWLAADGTFWCGEGCDLTNDGSVNSEDLVVFAESWLGNIAP